MFYVFRRLCKIFVVDQRLAVVLDGLLLVPGSFVTTTDPIIAVGIGLRHFYTHLERLEGGLILSLLEQRDPFFEVGIGKFPVPADAGIELDDRLFIETCIGV